MTQHQEAQLIARTYYNESIKAGSNASFAWNAAMALFKLEMHK